MSAVEPIPAVPGRPSGRIVLGIIAVAAVFATAVGVVYYRSWLKASPGLLVVQSDASMEGASVRIEGPDGIHEGILNQQGRYTVSFPVRKGTYTVRVTHRYDSDELPPFTIIENQSRVLRVSRPAPHPAPGGSAKGTGGT